MLNGADVDGEVRTSSKRLRKRRWLMMVRRQDAQERCAGTILQNLLDRRLYINPGRDRKLAPHGGDFASRRTEVFQQCLP